MANSNIRKRLANLQCAAGRNVKLGEESVDEAGLDDLLRRARRREPKALDELVSRFSERVFGLLYRLTGQREAAEDLLQETFLHVIRAIDGYEHAGKFEAWLFRIAANLARDRARKLARHERPVGLEDTPTLRVAESPSPGAGIGLQASTDPAERLSYKEAGQRLAECLMRLSESEREIIVLRHYSELSFREIAEMLGIPLGTALARAHRALQRLRRELEDDVR